MLPADAEKQERPQKTNVCGLPKVQGGAEFEALAIVNNTLRHGSQRTVD